MPKDIGPDIPDQMPPKQDRPGGRPSVDASGQPVDANILSWVLDTMPLGTVVWGADGRLLSANKGFTDLTGYTINDISGLDDWFSLAYPDPAYRAQVMADWQSSRITERAERCFKVTCRNGKVKDVEFRGVFLDQGRSLVTMADVTPRAMAEAALIRSEAMQRLILENMQETLSVLDAQGNFHYANSRAAGNMAGDSSADLAGRNIHEFLPQDQAEALLADYREIIASNRPMVREICLDMRTGRQSFRNTLTPMSQGPGKPMLILSLSLDITDRCRAEEMLRENEERFKALFEDAPDAIVVADAETGNLVQVNAAAERLLGASREELLTRHFTELHPPSMHEHTQARFQRHVAMHARNTFVPAAENVVLRADGGTVPVDIHARGITLGGRPCIMGVFRDATGRKQAEAAIKASEERFRSIIENVNMIAIQGYDETREVIFWNDASRLLYGYTAEEALGRKLEDLIIPEAMRQEVVAGVTRWIERGEAIPAGELTLRSKDGSEVPVFSSHVMYESAAGAKEMYCIDVDLLPIRRMQHELIQAKDDAEAASRAKSQFLANMSHELRTPLSGIMGMLQLLRFTDLDTDQEDYASAAYTSGQRLTNILSDILDLSKIEAGKMVLNDAPFSPHEVLDSVRDLFKFPASQAGLDLVIEKDPELPKSMLGDGQRLRQVLFNLTGNAIKFTPSGIVRVAAWSLPSPRTDRARVLFTISDTGIGIPDHMLDVIFDPFTQADSTHTRQYQGAGLGLSIVRRFVHLMQGTLCIDSSKDEGTAFHLSLCFPLARGMEQDEADSVHVPRIKPGLKVLVVEDEIVNRVALKRLLQIMGLTVLEACNGEEALALLAKESFDMVFMDVQMPAMDGMEATRRIREDPEFKHAAHVPIIAITAHAMTGDRETFLTAGMDDYLPKPVDAANLTRLIERVVSGRSSS